jgi:hypothetical protein
LGRHDGDRPNADAVPGWNARPTATTIVDCAQSLVVAGAIG